jgi:hypothetical protein
MSGDILYDIHEGILFPGILIFFYLAAEIGVRLGKHFSQTVGKEAHAHVATLEGALLGLFSLLLGFAFSMAMTRYDARRSIVVQEANDIQTTYLRAQLLPEQYILSVSNLLKAYVDSRVAFFKERRGSEAAQQELQRTNALQQSLWREAVQASHADERGIKTGYFIESLNGLIDDHTYRMAAMESHVPEVIFLLLIFVGTMTLAMTGYSSGLNNKPLRIPRCIMLVLTSATLIVIIDLDRPQRGFITVSEKAMIQLQLDLRSTPPI